MICIDFAANEADNPSQMLPFWPKSTIFTEIPPVMPVSVCRKAHFNAAHRLHNPKWSESENARIFGKCGNPNYHGHNYTLEVWVSGKINADSGFVIDLKILKELIETEIENRFDHKNLNLDTIEFKTLNPTAENICVVTWKLLRAKLDPSLQLKVRLYETERNSVEYAGE
jgi:6-pyruvoyltetrahydropterin/6-carboxytetrahydropterin synthase